MKQLFLVIAVLMLSLASCTKQASNKLAPKGNSEIVSKKGKGSNVSSTLSATATMTLTHNVDGTFSIDYGGAPDAIRVYFRGGDSLFSNGNVYPANSQAFVPAPTISFTSWVGTWTYYQAVVITGTEERDVNGILGANWAETFTNKVQ